eukprot:9748204-Alexandrium_andersonii.AAC.1
MAPSCHVPGLPSGPRSCWPASTRVLGFDRHPPMMPLPRIRALCRATRVQASCLCWITMRYWK